MPRTFKNELATTASVLDAAKPSSSRDRLMRIAGGVRASTIRTSQQLFDFLAIRTLARSGDAVDRAFAFHVIGTSLRRNSCLMVRALHSAIEQRDLQRPFDQERKRGHRMVMPAGASSGP